MTMMMMTIVNAMQCNAIWNGMGIVLALAYVFYVFICMFPMALNPILEGLDTSEETRIMIVMNMSMNINMNIVIGPLLSVVLYTERREETIPHFLS